MYKKACEIHMLLVAYVITNQETQSHAQLYK